MTAARALAFDFSGSLVSARTFDADGRLRVARTNISAAVVNDYPGSMIPADGLDQNRTYAMYRDPAELAAAAATFASIPLLVKHVEVSADNHRPNDVVGCVGSDVQFDAPFLTASLIVWAGSAIRAIETGATSNLSCGYRYVAVMDAGFTPDGVRYDGRMTQLVGQHLALCPRGRVAGCVVADGMVIDEDAAARDLMFPHRRRLSA